MSILGRQSVIPTSTAGSIIPIAAQDAKVYVDKYVGDPGSIAAEPSVANKGPLVFYTGNWFTTRSTDGETTWTYNSPFDGMKDFCCDQDVIYDPHNQIFIWFRQAIQDDTNHENYFRLAISRDTINWWYYDIKPTNFSSEWTKQWWDYPQLALTNNYLFITSNMFDDNISRAVVSSVPLKDLAADSAITFLYFEQSFEGQGSRTLTPVQGATDTMYIGTHFSNDQMRIYKWPEGSGTAYAYDRKIDPWTPSARGSMHCTSPDTHNWCAYSDNRVLGGWIQNGVLGFMWNVGEGNGFNYPYINMATFNEATDLSYLERPLVWNNDYAWMYGYASPNSRGLGLAAYWGGGSYYPILNVAIADNFVPNPPPWQMNWVASGANAPAYERWGDYIRVRPINGDESCSLWIGSGYILKGDSGAPKGYPSDSVLPYYYIFGREADQKSSCLQGITPKPPNPIPIRPSGPISPGGKGNPWETSAGQNCFEQWITEAMSRLNAYNGDSDFNARKPWSINKYGVLEGNPKFGSTSVSAPDDFAAHNNNKYWWMWDHYPNEISWTNPNWNGAGVPLLRDYVTKCVANAGGTPS